MKRDPSLKEMGMGGKAVLSSICYDKRYFKSGTEFLFDLRVSIPCSFLFIFVAFRYMWGDFPFFGSKGEFTKEDAMFFWVFLYLIYLSLVCPIMFFEGRRSIMFLKVSESGRIFSKDYSGKDIRWEFGDVSVSKTAPFPFWKRHLYRTSLLSKKNGNYQLLDKKTGRVYLANGDYFSDCLEGLVGMKDS